MFVDLRKCNTHDKQVHQHFQFLLSFLLSVIYLTVIAEHCGTMLFGSTRFIFPFVITKQLDRMCDVISFILPCRGVDTMVNDRLLCFIAVQLQEC